MRRSDLRSLAWGILATTLVISPFILFGDDEGQASETEKAELEGDLLDQEITQLEVTEQDVQEYIDSEGLFIVLESEYHSLQADVSDYEDVRKELEETKQKLKETIEEYESSSLEGEIIHQIYLVISSGMSSGEIAIILENAEVISDAADFLQYIEDEDLIMSIKVGNFILNSSMSKQEIVEKIT